MPSSSPPEPASLRVAHDLGGPSQHLVHPACTLLFSCVSGVQPQVRKTLGQAIARVRVQQELDALPILDFRAINPRLEHQSLRVLQDVTLTSFDLLGPVVTAL